MEPLKSTNVAGPIIIENSKVLLIRAKKDNGSSDWQFPGGKQEKSDIDFEATCKREAREELGIELNIKELLKEITVKDKNKEIFLIHYLAERVGEIQPGHEVVEWGWHSIDKLPSNCAPNVYEVIKEYKKKETEKREGGFNKK